MSFYPTTKCAGVKQKKLICCEILVFSVNSQNWLSDVAYDKNADI